MKLNVPFFNQTSLMNCGPVALQMVASYLGKDVELSVIEKSAGIEKDKGASTTQLAVASAEIGFKTRLISKNILFSEENLELDFYKKYATVSLESSKDWLEKAKKSGVEVEERTANLEEILSFVSEKSLPIVLLDWNVVRGEDEKGYQGHFVPVVGYDEKNVYVHNHGFNNPTPFMPIERGLFDKARKSKGTDEDILVVGLK